MDPLQFSLFFVALVVGYVLVHLRLLKFQEYLKEIAGIKILNERLKGVVDGMERVRLDRVEEQLQQLHEDLEGVSKGLARVERASRAGGGGGGSTVIAPGAEPSAADRIRAAVEGRLLAMGFTNLRLLTDLSKANLDEEVEVLLECEKQGMRQKGRVRSRNGAVIGVDIQSVAIGFP